jgi:hypothetical protein
MKKAEYNPMIGDTPATNAKAIASGTRARATVKPDNNSFLIFWGCERNKSSI